MIEDARPFSSSCPSFSLSFSLKITPGQKTRETTIEDARPFFSSCPTFPPLFTTGKLSSPHFHEDCCVVVVVVVADVVNDHIMAIMVVPGCWRNLPSLPSSSCPRLLRVSTVAKCNQYGRWQIVYGRWQMADIWVKRLEGWGVTHTVREHTVLLN